MLVRSFVPLVRLALITPFFLSACYLSHQRPGDLDGGRRDAATRDAATRDAAMRDAGRDGGVDAGPTSCCPRYVLVRREIVESFSEACVTPRLMAIEGEPAVVFVGPPDATGPSGTQYVRLAPDLSTRRDPVVVSQGSFTWGQPASEGTSFAVCWGRPGDGDVVRVYDANGNPRGDRFTLSDRDRSPCVSSAASAGHYAFVYETRDPDRAELSLVTDTGFPVMGVEPVEATGPGFVTASPGGFVVVWPHALGLYFQEVRRGSLDNDAALPYFDLARILVSGSRIHLLRLSATGWLHETLRFPSFAPELPTESLGAPTGGVPAVALDACGRMVVSLPDTRGIGVIDADASPRGTFFDGNPTSGPSVGDDSVLAIGDSIYVAFAAVADGESEASIHVDRWICAP
ncbi:MAG: hypothetical protein AB7S26_27525 [Sandaracinaceae bacterium]